ncbi:unnamed protein product [Protopolystoma xenopodis]|uniref:Uncharacterized protein n=1 Tax=Protopolystoma xenopodis TaxID=117903 RepID=A0A448WE05_9PLAT|nr:unnamed protein product [Protopolystoma xenopodis]
MALQDPASSLFPLSSLSLLPFLVSQNVISFLGVLTPFLADGTDPLRGWIWRWTSRISPQTSSKFPHQLAADLAGPTAHRGSVCLNAPLLSAADAQQMTIVAIIKHLCSAKPFRLSFAGGLPEFQSCS